MPKSTHSNVAFFWFSYKKIIDTIFNTGTSSVPEVNYSTVGP